MFTTTIDPLLRAVAELVENADETPPRKLSGQPGHSSTLHRTGANNRASARRKTDRMKRLRLGDLLRLLLALNLCPSGSLRRRDPLPGGTAHPAHRLRCFGSLHLPLRPALLQQPRQFPPGGGAHAATPAGLPCRSRRTTYSPSSSRVDSFECRNRCVNPVTLRTKFRKNPVGVHDGSSGAYPNRARRRRQKGFTQLGSDHLHGLRDR